MIGGMAELLAAIVIAGSTWIGTPETHAQLDSLGARLVGTWESEDGRQFHEWGVGRRLIRSRYRAVVEADRVVHDLRAYGDGVERFVETWTFGGEGYRWRLERPGPDGAERVMGGSYLRVAGSGG
ncbi:MAG: hypothetical protein PVI57_18975 [Gemmatimonadota bacterium]|jgi:hypothetical protein